MDDDDQQPQQQQQQQDQPSQQNPDMLRRAALKDELASHERSHIRNRWVTDKTALTRNKDVRFQEKFNRNAPKRLAKHDMFLKAEGNQRGGLETEVGEVTDRVTQNDILGGVDLQTQCKKFNLALDKHGPYAIDFSRNGTHLAFAGRRGHVSSMRWQDFALDGETFLKDRCTDIKYLVDHSMFAVAQSKFTYMYTSKCVEMHVLPKFANVTVLGYLPRHMLLVGASSQYSTMQWMDVSTGDEVCSKHPAIVQDPTLSLAVNPANGVVVTGDTRGVLKLWSPTVADPLVQIKGHRGGVAHCAVHPSGRYTVTCGADNACKVWDIRTLRPLEEWKMSYVVDSIDVSQSGLVAVGGGTNLQIWRNMFTSGAASSGSGGGGNPSTAVGGANFSKPFRPWMKHNLGYGNAVCSLKFCPFEDILAVGHSNGIATMIVPGAGEANPDFFEANPYETDVHRKERVVRNLLDKLPADTISLDLQIANVDEERLAEYQAALQANRKARNIKEKKEKRSKPQGDDAPTGIFASDPSKIGADVDEIDEDLGVEEKGPTAAWKSKKEVAKERKMVRWDQKDTSDKIRSKQVLRHSRLVMKQRKTRRYMESLKEGEEQEKAKSGAGGGGGGDEEGDVADSSALTTSVPQLKLKKSKSALRSHAGKIKQPSPSSSMSALMGNNSSDAAGGGGGEQQGEPDDQAELRAARRRRRTRDESTGGDPTDRATFRQRREGVSNAALRRFIS